MDGSYRHLSELTQVPSRSCDIRPDLTEIMLKRPLNRVLEIIKTTNPCKLRFFIHLLNI